MPLWYDKEQALFETILKDHPRIEIVRVPGGYALFLITIILLSSSDNESYCYCYYRNYDTN